MASAQAPTDLHAIDIDTGDDGRNTDADGRVTADPFFRTAWFLALLLVTVAVALSLAPAVLVLVRPRRTVFLAVAGFAVLFAAFDIVEVIHQINNNRVGVAAIAVALVLVHAVAALVSRQHKDPVPRAA